VDARLDVTSYRLAFGSPVELAAKLFDLGLLLLDDLLEMSDELAIGAVVAADQSTIAVVAGLHAACKFAGSKNRCGCVEEGRMWWTVVATPVHLRPRIWQTRPSRWSTPRRSCCHRAVEYLRSLTCRSANGTGRDSAAETADRNRPVGCELRVPRGVGGSVRRHDD
jgi:hypothetical protein